MNVEFVEGVKIKINRFGVVSPFLDLTGRVYLWLLFPGFLM